MNSWYKKNKKNEVINKKKRYISSVKIICPHTFFHNTSDNPHS